MHREADMRLWQGRIDAEPGGRGLRWHQAVTRLPPGGEAAGIVLLGVCSDEGVLRNQGRPGARRGPDAIRQALAGQACHLLRPLYDAGNLLLEDGNLEALQQEQAELVAALLRRGHFPLLLGGGHEIAFGSYLGLLRALGHEPTTLGIINVDAHFDLRHAPLASSGTPFRQMAEHCRAAGRAFACFCLGVSETANTAALFERAAALGVDYLKDEDLSAWILVTAERRLRAFIGRCDALYLSIDLDVLPAAVAPGVSAPAPRGLPLDILEHLLRFIREQAGGKLRLAEIAEYNPDFDRDGRTAGVAARLCHLLLRELPPEFQPRSKVML
ncbi:MAG TPA: formimidoylglutamase [Geopsychrobacteraceae bacterium]